MKVICKSNRGQEKTLTTGKEYEVIELKWARDGYLIINDKLEKQAYFKHRFYSVDEIRDIKLNQIGI